MINYTKFEVLDNEFYELSGAEQYEKGLEIERELKSALFNINRFLEETTTEAETEAFTKAFEILEIKLKGEK